MPENKIIDPEAFIEDFLKEARKINDGFHYLNLIDENFAKEAAKKIKGKKFKGNFYGLPISVKDCICVNGMESRAGSKILSNYKPVLNATAVERIQEQDGLIFGKTGQDEFGYGGFSVNTGIDFDIPLNPFDKERVCGGSSGGAAGMTQKISQPHLALAESTGGSIANPASFCGVIGFTPTYSRVSRFGLIDYANSLDKIGLMAKEPELIAKGMEIISGKDEKDSTCSNNSVPKYSDYLNKEIKGLRIGIVSEFMDKLPKPIFESMHKKLKEFEKQGALITEVNLPANKNYAIPTYYILAMTETSTNLAKYCGLRYGLQEDPEDFKGNYNDYFKKIRTEGFGLEAKRRLMLGTFARMTGWRDAYYVKAAKVRTVLIEEFKKTFEKVDLIVHPTMPLQAPRISEIKELSALQNYQMDAFTMPSNLAGLPHVSINAGYNHGLPIGLMLTGNHFKEETLMQFLKFHNGKEE